MLDLLLIVELGLACCLLPWLGLMGAVVAAALIRSATDRTQSDASGDAGSRFLIVIPAHDEAAVIALTIASCRSVAYPADRFQVVVIADNCGDSTAAVAEAAGALVLVRQDPARKSKGFALEDFFERRITHPDLQPADAYVLIDADTSVAPDILRVFNRGLQNQADFIQGYYSVRNADASWRTRMLTYAFSLTNGVWLRGADALGWGVGLKGNGMCFRAAALNRFPWRAHGLVEDMEFAWALRTSGERVRFAPLARVYGEMVSRGGTGAASQRQRWEAGRAELRRSVRPQLWASSSLSLGSKIVGQIELSFPPLSRLVVGLTAASLGTLAGLRWGEWHRTWLGLAVCFAGGWGILLAYILSPIVVMRLPIRYVLTLIYMPYYILWKATLSRFRAPRDWVRTPRENSTS